MQKIYHQTRNILLVKEIPGHKSIEHHEIYATRLRKEEDYEIAEATALEENQKLLQVSFEYVIERSNIEIYRRPKTFAKYMDKR
jgi:hypothetical protein